MGKEKKGGHPRGSVRTTGATGATGSRRGFWKNQKKRKNALASFVGDRVISHYSAAVVSVTGRRRDDRRRNVFAPAFNSFDPPPATPTASTPGRRPRTPTGPCASIGRADASAETPRDRGRSGLALVAARRACRAASRATPGTPP